MMMMIAERILREVGIDIITSSAHCLSSIGETLFIVNNV